MGRGLGAVNPDLRLIPTRGALKLEGIRSEDRRAIIRLEKSRIEEGVIEAQKRAIHRVLLGRKLGQASI